MTLSLKVWAINNAQKRRILSNRILTSPLRYQCNAHCGAIEGTTKRLSPNDLWISLVVPWNIYSTLIMRARKRWEINNCTTPFTHISAAQHTKATVNTGQKPYNVKSLCTVYVWWPLCVLRPTHNVHVCVCVCLISMKFAWGPCLLLPLIVPSREMPSRLISSSKWSQCDCLLAIKWPLA